MNEGCIGYVSAYATIDADDSTLRLTSTLCSRQLHFNRLRKYFSSWAQMEVPSISQLYLRHECRLSSATMASCIGPFARDSLMTLPWCLQLDTELRSYSGNGSARRGQAFSGCRRGGVPRTGRFHGTPCSPCSVCAFHSGARPVALSIGLSNLFEAGILKLFPQHRSSTVSVCVRVCSPLAPSPIARLSVYVSFQSSHRHSSLSFTLFHYAPFSLSLSLRLLHESSIRTWALSLSLSF